MNKLVKTLVLAPAVVILAACDLSTLSVKRDFTAFRETVSELKDPGYVDMTITGDSYSSTDLREVYHWVDGEWVADENNETHKLQNKFITAKEFANELNKSTSDTNIKNYYTFYTGVNSYKVEYNRSAYDSTATATFKFDKYGYITYYYSKSSVTGVGTDIVELKFAYAK